MILMKNWTPETIKRIRKKYKLSQQQLAELLGVSNNYVHLLEKGVKKPGKTLCILLGYVEKELKEKERS